MRTGALGVLFTGLASLCTFTAQLNDCLVIDNTENVELFEYKGKTYDRKKFIQLKAKSLCQRDVKEKQLLDGLQKIESNLAKSKNPALDETIILAHKVAIARIHSRRMGICFYCPEFLSRERVEDIKSTLAEVNPALFSTLDAADAVIKEQLPLTSDNEKVNGIYTTAIETVAPIYDEWKTKMEHLLMLCDDYEELADVKQFILSALSHYPAKPETINAESGNAYFDSARLFNTYALNAQRCISGKEEMQYEKIKPSRIGEIIAFISILLVFLSTLGQTSEKALNAGVGFETASKYSFLYTLLIVAIISVILMAVPLICVIVKKRKLSAKKGNLLCVCNSIIACMLSFAASTIGFPLAVGGLGALMFYFINKWLFVDETAP